MSSMRSGERSGSPFNPAGSHALALAAEKAPGVGLPASKLAWCSRCHCDKPVKGSAVWRGLRVCGDCKGPKQ